MQPAVNLAACDDFYRAVCLKRGVTRDPSGSVHPDAHGEIRALRIYQDIIRKHPDWSSDQVDDELVRTIFTPERRARLESAYEWVRHSLEQFIERQPLGVFSVEEKAILRERIRRTKLELPPPASVYEDEPDLFTKNDVFYERLRTGETRMRVGGAYLFTAKSWFNIVFTIGHEFAHAIDPCEMRQQGRALKAYDDLAGCFAARGLIEKPTTALECDGETDHLSETFADWMAVHVTAQALAEHTDYKPGQLLSAATNAVRDLCEQEDSPDQLDTQFHPTPRKRIDTIFGSNPEVRKVLGCAVREPAANSPSHCEFNVRPTP